MTNAIRTLGKLEWQATLLLVVVFGAGIAVGAAIDHSRAAPVVAAPPPQAVWLYSAYPAISNTLDCTHCD